MAYQSHPITMHLKELSKWELPFSAQDYGLNLDNTTNKTTQLSHIDILSAAEE